MANIQKQNGRGVIQTREVVSEKVQAILAKHPDLISFDPLDERYEALTMRCKTDPGPGHGERDGWEGQVCDWWFGAYTVVDQDTGELVTLPSLALITSDGALVRFSGSEPAVRSWLVILREIGPDRVRQGLRVRVSLRPSQTAGRHYWLILPA